MSHFSHEAVTGGVGGGIIPSTYTYHTYSHISDSRGVIRCPGTYASHLQSHICQQGCRMMARYTSHLQSVSHISVSRGVEWYPDTRHTYSHVSVSWGTNDAKVYMHHTFNPPTFRPTTVEIWVQHSIEQHIFSCFHAFAEKISPTCHVCFPLTALHFSFVHSVLCVCVCVCVCVIIIIIIMYIYHALINALSAHTIHINLNMIFYTHVKHSPTKTIYIKYYLKNN